MRREPAPDTSRVSPEYAGQWTVWNREQTRLIGSGSTFEDAKRAAASAGERSVILAKAPAAPYFRRAWHWTHVMAVFIALTPGINTLHGGEWISRFSADSPAISTEATDDPDDAGGAAAADCGFDQS